MRCNASNPLLQLGSVTGTSECGRIRRWRRSTRNRLPCAFGAVNTTGRERPAPADRHRHSLAPSSRLL